MWRAAAGCLGAARAVGRTARLPWVGLHEAETEPLGLLVAPLQAEPLGLLVAPLQVRWKKKTKRKKKPKKDDRSPERVAASGGYKERIFDRVLEPETPHQMSMTVKQHMRGLLTDGRHIIRRKKDHSAYTNYRVLRIAGLTHDNPKEETDRRGFVTPLTQLQDGSHLPRSPLHRRFKFPHTFNYKVYWGPPSVQDEPNKAEGSMVGVNVAIRLQDLPLTQRQLERLADIVGPSCIDEETGVLSLHVDDFPERNQNAALAGDLLEELLREASSLEELPWTRTQVVGHIPGPQELAVEEVADE